MLAYIIRRVLLMVPTILGIMALSFVVVQFAPGGPIERVIAQLQGTDVGATDRFAGGGSDFSAQDQDFAGSDDGTSESGKASVSAPEPLLDRVAACKSKAIHKHHEFSRGRGISIQGSPFIPSASVSPLGVLTPVACACTLT